MPYGIPGSDAPGIEDSICRLRSSSVTRIGSTQFLYQAHDLHWSSACASSKTSLTFRILPQICLLGALRYYSIIGVRCAALQRAAGRP